ncbi:AzlD domain-containing protein [Kaustia mangrovi]|uniref:AzlD domain-containing protein n=1 Tax=Kaustia mangrovi TaxID=2593653 RepID=A0A7S8C1H4_9HYPH|nr:AzlD domain-containing protein [Kaustia mangrovi]QPC41631.1 AzlD domain-containing protein [Kaustia mangrovi]
MSLDAMPVWLVILVAGAAVTYVWRMIGAMVVSRLDPEGGLLLWVRAVATALVAALVVRLVLMPSEILAAASLASRLAALAIGLALFFLFRRNTAVGVGAAVVSLIAIELVARAVAGP